LQGRPRKLAIVHDLGNLGTAETGQKTAVCKGGKPVVELSQVGDAFRRCRVLEGIAEQALGFAGLQRQRELNGDFVNALARN